MANDVKKASGKTATKKVGSKSSAKKSNTKTSVVNDLDKIEEVVEIVAEKVTTNVVVDEIKDDSKKEARLFHDRDLIPCICNFPGSVGMTGKRTGNVYLWEDMGVVEYVEYQDLRSEVFNKKSNYIYEPLIIIDDEDFLNQYEQIAKMYHKFYTSEEIVSHIENSTLDGMVKFINKLPDGIKKNVMNIAATMIEDGRLDSVRKIKKIDEIFGTELGAHSQFTS